VTFCTAINYGALGLNEQGFPYYKNQDKCIECGICYMICPALGVLDKETEEKFDWNPPMGKVIQTSVNKAAEPKVRQLGTDGGVVTALLLHLFDQGFIDGAVVSKHSGLFQRQPWLASSRQEILDAAGSYFDASHGMALYSDMYSTFTPSVHALKPLVKQGLRRVAFVGTPCQIKTIRKMDTLGVVPSDAIRYVFGLFCSGNFSFGEEERKKLEQVGGFKWDDVQKINLKGGLMLYLKDGNVVTVPMDELDFMKRGACSFCMDYAAEYADISFGGVGAEEGWTTVITRTPQGRATLADARTAGAIETYKFEDPAHSASGVLSEVEKHSAAKKERAAKYLERLGA
jgi:coenzyme F420 hydrogenase subunit beta